MNPKSLLMKEPFFRGLRDGNQEEDSTFEMNTRREASLPSMNKVEVTQDQFMRELDQYSHKVLFDNNVPSIYMKIGHTDEYQEIKYQKSAIPFQKKILSKQTLHLCAKNIKISHLDRDPNQKDQESFISIKQGWVTTHQQQAFYEAVIKQKSLGDVALLYYMNLKNEISFRTLSYDEGYVLCPHYNENKELIIMAIYYEDKDSERIDAYDDTYIYRYKKDKEENRNIISKLTGDSNWKLKKQIKHGFNEIPICYKRENDVAWGDSQLEIETTEILWNIISVIMKRNGWGIIFVKGSIDPKAKKIAGNVLMQAKGGPGNEQADAKVLSAPTPEGMHEHIDKHINFIQLGSSTTFVQPSDIKVSGKVSGLTIQLMMTMDYECALEGKTSWTPFVNKMLRLFTFGYARQLVLNKEKPDAITAFSKLKINAVPTIWMPRSETELAQTLVSLVSSGVISKKTATEQIDFKNPDEDSRIKKDLEELKKQAEKSIINKQGEKKNNEVLED